MKKIKIVTDSASSLPGYLAEKYNISIIEIPVHLGGKNIPTGSLDYFYKLLREGNMPTTSAPSPGSYYQVYKEACKEYDTVISIHISGKVSGTYQSACLAREMLEDEDIRVVDSENISMATGFLTLVAARAAGEGYSVDEIIDKIDKMKHKVGGLVALPTLKYLAKGGRVSQISALLGNILAIKPILIINSGEVKLTDKARSVPQALTRMIKMVEERIGDARVRVAVIHSDAQEKAATYLEKVSENLNCAESFIAEMGPGLAVHGGPGMMGLVWMEE